MHRLLLCTLFLVGWLSLLMSMVFFYFLHNDLEMTYWLSGPDMEDADEAGVAIGASRNILHEQLKDGSSDECSSGSEVDERDENWHFECGGCEAEPSDSDGD